MNAAIGQTVDQWIHEEDLPPRANLKVIRRFDGLYPQDEDEREAYWDFIHWFMTREHALILSIPKPRDVSDFWQVELDELGHDVSAFNTVDYARLHPFDKEAYRVKKIYERVKDLALLHSCLSDQEGRERMYRRFRRLVEDEVRDRAVTLLKKYQEDPQRFNKFQVFEQIAQLNRCIRRCNDIWRRWSAEP
ncbi:MAG: hypothetical protein C4582_05295 [Desulfobacteraceae bacterium]|jgi:hypothetical protein|nr:MAG: hypothetical protein C4582_05295 [Desulfobacteraceae bacterium]